MLSTRPIFIFSILGNHLPQLWNTISEIKGGRIDFVLDNAGFELYCDCVFGAPLHSELTRPPVCLLTWGTEPADYLIQSGLASHIHFHGKRIPWFVSDVTRKDWQWLLNSMVYGQLFVGASEVRRVASKWGVGVVFSINVF